MAIPITLPDLDAAAAGREYRARLVRDGGSIVVKRAKAGTICRRFLPWLAESGAEVRARVADLIYSAFLSGRSLKDTAHELRTIRGECESTAYRIIRREIRGLQHIRDFARFRKDGIRQGTWRLDLEEGSHTGRNGKIFDLDDPIWTELDLEGCICWCEPVVPEVPDP